MLRWVSRSLAPLSPDSSELVTDVGQVGFPNSERVPRRALSEPVKMGEYTIVEKLGQGGMSEVFLAVAVGPGGARQLLVIKTLIHQMNDEPEIVQMFLDEVRLAAELNHPHVVQTYKAGSFEGQPYLAMEYLRGQPLSRIVRRAASADGDPIPFPLVARLVADALSGLHYAHSAGNLAGESFGLIHRDISPQNIFVTYDGVVKILDFGIAKATTQESKTQTGLIKGKFSYIAPEQAVGENVDHRADIWSMGVVLWECLALRRLFKGKTDAATLQMSLTMNVPSPSEFRAGIPAKLAQIALRALERDVTRRYQSAQEMQTDLEAWLASHTRASSSFDLTEWMSNLFGDVIDAEHTRIRAWLSRPENARRLTPPPPPVSMPSSAPGVALPPREAHSGRHRLGLAALLLAVFVAVGAVVKLQIEPEFSSLPSSPAQPPAATVQRPNTVTHASSIGNAAPAPTSQPRPAAATVVNALRQPPKRFLKSQRLEQDKALSNGPAIDPQAVSERSAAFMKAPPAQAPGVVTIDSTPWSYVSINGKSVGTTPVMGLKLEAGTYQVRLRNPELGLTASYPISVKAGQVVTRRFGLE